MPEPRTDGFRFSMAETPDGLRVVIPVRGRTGRLVPGFVAVWLVCWDFAGLLAGLHILPAGPDVSIGQNAWAALAVGNVVALSILVWYLAGREVVLVNDRSLTIRAELFGIGRSVRFDRGRVQHLRAYDERSAEGWTGVLFDDGMRLRRFGTALAAPEVAFLAETVRDRLGLEGDAAPKSRPPGAEAGP